MNIINIQEILPFAEMPSRYLGSEVNSIKKDLAKVDLTFALAFPDLYEIGTSHFGMQILYTILNQQKNIAAERFFTPAPDMEKILRDKEIPLFSLESSIDLKSFDIIGFSLLYELNFTNILTMLNLSAIPFYAEDRVCVKDSGFLSEHNIMQDKNIDSNRDFNTKSLNSKNIKYPLIIAGGPCTFNPEPLADFFDAFVIGDGEQVILDISNLFIKWKKDVNSSKKELLKSLSKIDGVYIPSFFKPTYKPISDKLKPDDCLLNEQNSNNSLSNQVNSNNSLSNKSELSNNSLSNQVNSNNSFLNNTIQHLEPLESGYEKIKRAILPDISTAEFPTSPIVPFGKPVHDRLRLEIARGCSRGCRFCQAGMIYRPVRERSLNELNEIAQTALKKTGYSDLSLLSLSTGDYSNLPELMDALMEINPENCISISLPSIRAGRLNSKLMKIIKKVKKTGFTIAPEAGTQRLRDVINKNITKEDILTTVKSAFELGWQNIKLYFMNGLPTETKEDIKAVADMARELVSIKIKGRGKSSVNISFAPFIPKPHTPFERCSQIPPDKALENLYFLKQNLNHPNINLKWQNPKMSLLEGVWARGDRRLSKVLIKAWEKGCRLDGWSDMFNFYLWQEAFDECGIDPYFYTVRERKKDEVLPWSHIDCGISDKFMQSEFEKAMKEELTQDCREHGCTGCGICDFKTIKPVLYNNVSCPDHQNINNGEIEAENQNIINIDEHININDERQDADINNEGKNINNEGKNIKIVEQEKNNKNEENPFSKLTIFYSRLGNAKYFGHLELAKIIRRAIRRTGLKVRYSTGFSPAMKISFDNPLPVGMESEEEFFTIQVDLSQKTNLSSQGILPQETALPLQADQPQQASATNITPQDIVDRLNQELPKNIAVLRCVYSDKIKKQKVLKNNSDSKNNDSKNNDSVAALYRINLKTFFINQDMIDQFMNLSEYIVEKLSSKGTQRTTDLRKVIEKIEIINGTKENSSQLIITMKPYEKRTVRPSEILTEVFEVPDYVIRSADIIKLKLS